MTSSVLSVLANVNPSLVVAVLGLAYLHRACTYWRWPLIVDPLLLALYAWHPSLGMLAFVLALYAVRHVGALAREVVMIFNLDAYEGWTPRVIVFLLPGLAAYTDAPALPRYQLPPRLMLRPCLMWPTCRRCQPPSGWRGPTTTRVRRTWG